MSFSGREPTLPRKATGAMAMKALTLSLYSGRMEAMTRKAVVPWEWPQYTSESSLVEARTKSIMAGMSYIPISCHLHTDARFKWMASSRHCTPRTHRNPPM